MIHAMTDFTNLAGCDKTLDLIGAVLIQEQNDIGCLSSYLLHFKK